MSIAEFVKSVNKKRLANKNNWYFWSGVVNGKMVDLKGYNTYIQQIKYNSKHGYKIKDGWPMDLKVNEFKAYLSSIQV